MPRRYASWGLMLMVLTGCTAVHGPTIPVYVGEGKTFEQYQVDAMACRQYAAAEIREDGIDPATATAAKAGVLTGLLGAATGAAIGAVSGRPGAGAAIGAATGAATGTAVGVARGDTAGRTRQQQYNQFFAICMESKRHRVPSLPLMGR